MKLDAVQIEALNRSKGKPGFAYFMEQGLGKTLTALADFSERVADDGVTRLVVLCPNSFKSGWVEEIKKHGFAFDTHIFESGADTINNAFLRKSFNKPPVLIINFEAIRLDKVQEYVKQFVTGRKSFLVVDESAQCKTHDSAQTKATIIISYMFDYKRILSGKPAPSGPQDLWAQMRVIGNLEGRDYFAFKTAFCKMGGFKMKQVVGAQNEDILAGLIDPWVFYATKEDWTDLPPKRRMLREYDMGPEISKYYKQMENEFVVWLNETEHVAVDVAIAKYSKLAQIQAGFIIDEDKKVHELVPPEKNPRVKLLKNIIDTEVVGKFSVPYINKYSFNLLSRALADYNLAYITGGMTPDELDAQKHKFNNDKDCRGILLQMKASKYGHTLLGQPNPYERCSTQIFFQNTYSLDDRSQIEDRHHRRGQTAKCVNYIDLVGSPIDKAAIKALQRNESVFQAIFNSLRR